MRFGAMLASVMTGLFTAAAHAVTVSAENAASMIDQDVTVCGKVFSTRYNESAEGKPTFVHMGAAFPQHKFAIRIDGVHREEFQPSPDSLVDKTVCVTGRIRTGPGQRPEMVVDSPSALEVMM